MPYKAYISANTITENMLLPHLRRKAAGNTIVAPYSIEKQMNYIDVEAGMNIPINRFVGLSNDLVMLADSTQNIPALGFVVKEYSLGSLARVYLEGVFPYQHSCSSGSPAFLSSNGILTDNPGSVGFVQVVGIFLPNNKILITIQPPEFFE